MAWSAQAVPELRVGPGVLHDVGRVVRELAVEHPLVVTDRGVSAAGWPSVVADLIRGAGGRPAVWDLVEPDPACDVVDCCRDAIVQGGHDGLVAVGGGSVLDVAKAGSGLAALGGSVLDYEGLGKLDGQGPPVVAVPTASCGGAEVTRHCVVAAPTGRKFAVSGRWLAPRVVLADPTPMSTAPRAVLVDTVLDSLLHAIEAYLARAATPFSDVAAQAAIVAITAVPGAFAIPGDTAQVTTLLGGCLAAGVAMANANAGVVHALGYPLTAEYRIPHGRANALVAGPALRRVAAAAPGRCAELAALASGGASEPAAVVDGVLDQLGVRRGLRSYGVPASALPRLAGLATEFRPVLRNAPLLPTEADLLEIYEEAWSEAWSPRAV